MRCSSRCIPLNRIEVQADITMNPRMHLFCVILAIGFPAYAAAVDNSEQVAFFEKRIRPVLVRHCYACHSQDAEQIEAGLVLDSHSGLIRGGETGPAIVPGDADQSTLIQAMRYDGLEMPPDSKLPDHVIKDFERWIAMGAPDPRKTESGDQTASKKGSFQADDFWAFRPPEIQPVADCRGHSWTRRRIDSYVLKRQESAGLQPSPPENQRALIRRLSYDLLGLPPTRAEIDRFLHNRSEDAYDRLVDRLLASPRYGERMARMWLDVARYAEDQAHIVGNNESLFCPNAYVYRDWVIHALNVGMPFDRFVQLQIAADLLEPDDEANLPALGFFGIGPKYYNRGRLEVKADEWEDRVDVVTRGVLGLTVACARCHDHKYDPITTEDYYGLAGVFASTQMFNRPLNDQVEKANDGQSKKASQSWHIVREGKAQDLHVFIRGNPETKGPIVKRRFPTILGGGVAEPFLHGSGRLELAPGADQPQ